MPVKLADNFITSDQTESFPMLLDKGKKYMCVFYIYNPTFIKGKAGATKTKMSHGSRI